MNTNNKKKVKEITDFIKNVNLLDILREDDTFDNDKKINNYFTIKNINNKTAPLTCYLIIIHYSAESEYYNPCEPTETKHSLVIETDNPKINETIQLNDWKQKDKNEAVEWNFSNIQEYTQKLKDFLNDYAISDEYKLAIKTIWNEISNRVDTLAKNIKIKNTASKNLINKYNK
jgi:hypothetical protein